MILTVATLKVNLEAVLGECPEHNMPIIRAPEGLVRAAEEL